MKIAVLHFHRLGGSGIVAYELGHAMATMKGYDVHFVGMQPPLRFRDGHARMHYHQIELKEYPAFDFQPYVLALASQLVDLALRIQINLIHSHYAIPHAIAALLAKQMLHTRGYEGLSCITTLHGTDITIVGAHPTMQHITRYAIEASDQVVAVSHSLRRDTEKQFGIAKGRIQVAYNFIRSHCYPSRNARPLQERPSLIFFHSSNLREAKNPLAVLRLFDAARKKINMPCQLYVAGEGPLLHVMKQEAHALGLQKKVRFLSTIKDITVPLKEASFYLSASFHESFGLSTLEAMACGVVPISSRVGGVPEVITDGYNGLLFDLNHSEDVTERVVSVTKDNRLYERLSKNAYDTAHQTFHMQNTLEMYDKIYTSLNR